MHENISQFCGYKVNKLFNVMMMEKFIIVTAPFEVTLVNILRILYGLDIESSGIMQTICPRGLPICFKFFPTEKEEFGFPRHFW